LYDGILPHQARLVFAVLSLFFLGTTLLWLRLDRSPPAWDDGYYLTNSLVMYDALTDGGLPAYARQFLTIMGIKPPLIAILPTPVYLIAGRKPRAALLVNLACLLILFAALYRLGKRYASRRAGLIALCIAGTMPIELPIARRLPDGGVAHVFANTSSNRLTSADIAKCNVTFDDKLQLTGLSVQRTPEGLQVTYRWRCLKPLDRNYWCFTHIVDGKGAIAGYLDHQIVSLWNAGDTAIEKLAFRFSEAQKSESYRLRLGVFDRASGDRLPITASDFPLTDKGTATVVGETQVVR
jgi:hypothetical protein